MRSIKRKIVGGFILSHDNKLLLGHSIDGGVYPGCWIVPGGGVEQNETKLDALKREILEETGIDISSAVIEKIEGNLSGQSEKVLRDSGEKVIVNMLFCNYKVTLPDDSANIQFIREDDFIDARWFSNEELVDIKLSPPTSDTLKILGILKS